VKAVGGSTLITESAIQRRVVEMAAEISNDYRGTSVTVVGILKGSFMFISDLIRQIDESIPIEVEFMTVSSYGDAMVSSGRLHIEQDITTPLEDKDILLVEDIVDSGLTIGGVQRLLLSRKPRSLRIATLLEKETGQPHHLQLDYIGFRIPNVFVVGYGLDAAQRFRNLKEIRALDAE